MEYEEEEFQGKKELDIHRYKVAGFETRESKMFLLEEHYKQMTNQCLTVILISLIVLLIIFFL